MSRRKEESGNIWKSIFVLLIIACLICVAVVGIYLLKDKKEDQQAVEQHEQLVEEVVESVEETEAAIEDEKAVLPIDFESLWEINPEIYAWIQIPDTNIDYPVLQHMDEDQSYYLTRDIYGNTTSEGSIYTEYYNSKSFMDPNTILYGHNMKNGSMFHNVRYFTKQDYFDEHQEAYIYLPDKILKYEIIACYEYDDRHLLASFDFWNEEVYAQYLDEIMNPRSMSAIVRDGVALTTDDRLITLSTCVANKPNNRRLLQAVLIEEIEAEYRGQTDDRFVDTIEETSSETP